MVKSNDSNQQANSATSKDDAKKNPDPKRDDAWSFIVNKMDKFLKFSDKIIEI